MQARMKNPAQLVNDAYQPIMSLWGAAQTTGLPERTLHLIHLRASQINGCAVCIDGGVRLAKKGGETDERLFAVAAWREAPYFTPAERAALALTESVTRIADREDPVPDDVWNEAARQFDERALAGLLLAISTVNVWNRLNVSTRQIAGAWKP
jgi:AhpD family alkylhydroperoxidase